MGKAEFGLPVLPVDLEDDVRAVPLASIFDKVDVAVHDMPDDLLAGHPFSDPLCGVMDVFIAVSELGAELVGASVKFSRPPSTNVVDGVEDFFGRLLDRKRGRVIFGVHCLLSLWLSSHS